MLAQEKPGLGIDVDEKLAAKFPFPPGPPNFDYSWGTTRRRTGRSSGRSPHARLGGPRFLQELAIGAGVGDCRLHGVANSRAFDKDRAVEPK